MMLILRMEMELSLRDAKNRFLKDDCDYHEEIIKEYKKASYFFKYKCNTIVSRILLVIARLHKNLREINKSAYFTFS